MEAIASRLEAITLGLEAITLRLEAIASSYLSILKLLYIVVLFVSLR